MIILKVTKVGTSDGVVLPKALLARLNVSNGDNLYVTESPEGIRITAHNPEFVEQMAAATYVAKKRRNMLRALA